MSAELLYTTRGDLVETIQRGHVAVVDVHRRLIASSGDPEATSYMRSAAKPLQATMVVQSGAAGRFGLAGPLLAICCASHQGEPGHVAAVREVLARAGVPESALQCGVHAPVYGPAAAALWRAGEEPAAVHNNCSGWQRRGRSGRRLRATSPSIIPSSRASSPTWLRSRVCRASAS